MQKPRVLLLAENCNPDWPSLPVVGYKAAIAISEVADVTLVTHVRNREAIERSGTGKVKNVVYLDNEFIARPMYKLSQILRGGNDVAWTTNIAMAYLPYIVFEYLAWKKFKKDLKAGAFDLVHRLTPMSPTLPSPMASLSPVPFVLGPLNGGLKWPSEFTSELRREREWMTYFRKISRFLPYARSTYRRSSAILAAFPHTIADLPEMSRSRTMDFAEVGFDPVLFQAERPEKSDSLTFLFAGRLVPYKCADVALEAFAGSEALRNCKFQVVGDGPELPRLKEVVAKYQADSRVEFVGRKSQAEVGQIMRRAHVFAFPSIRELGAGVVVEAMACGLCCIVVDYGGPGGLIDESRGVKVPLSTKANLVLQVRDEMEKLACDRSRIDRLGKEARQYAIAEYSWAARAKKMFEVYRWAIGLRREKPFT